MIIHILVDIPQEAARNDADDSESNTRQINPSIALRIRDPARLDHGLVCQRIALDAREQIEFFEQRGTGQLDGLGDDGDARDVELGRHDAADVVLRVGDELVDEDVVVDCITDGAADDADCERQGLGFD